MIDWQNVDSVADAILYEGYALYPYRPSAIKNQQRWTFGRLVPQRYAAAHNFTDPYDRQCSAFLQASHPSLTLRLRFLQVASPEDLGDHAGAWERGYPRDLVFPVSSTPSWSHCVEWDAMKNDAGMLKAMRFCMHVTQEPVTAGIPDPHALLSSPALWRISVRVENLSDIDGEISEREALQHSLIATHWILADDQGQWVSVTAPPDSFASLTNSLTQSQIWPFLAGDRQDGRILLASPIILYDYPQIAPNSPGNFFDGAEIDEMLTLRILTMTSKEQEEAMAADPQILKILDRTKNLSRDALYQMHGLGHCMPPPERGGEQP